MKTFTLLYFAANLLRIVYSTIGLTEILSESAAVADRPGWYHPGGDTRLKLICLWRNLERTLDKRRGKMGVVRRRQLKKIITFQWAMTKKAVSILRKNIVSVNWWVEAGWNLMKLVGFTVWSRRRAKTILSSA